MKDADELSSRASLVLTRQFHEDIKALCGKIGMNQSEFFRLACEEGMARARAGTWPSGEVPRADGAHGGADGAVVEEISGLLAAADPL